MSDPIIAICGPLWTLTVVPGSERYTCVKCGRECACGPVGQRVINEEGGLPHCPKCGIARMQECKAKGTPMDVHPASEESLKAAFEHMNKRRD